MVLGRFLAMWGPDRSSCQDHACGFWPKDLQQNLAMVDAIFEWMASNTCIDTSKVTSQACRTISGERVLLCRSIDSAGAHCDTVCVVCSCTNQQPFFITLRSPDATIEVFAGGFSYGGYFTQDLACLRRWFVKYMERCSLLVVFFLLWQLRGSSSSLLHYPITL